MNALRAEHVEGSQAAGERITVTLIPKAREDLVRLRERTSLSTTDLGNRVITLYEFLDQLLRTGHDFLARDPATGNTSLVRLDAPEGQAASARPARTGWGRAGLPAPGDPHGRHRRRHPAPTRLLPALAGWFMYLACLGGQEVRASGRLPARRPHR